MTTESDLALGISLQPVGLDVFLGGAELIKMEPQAQDAEGGGKGEAPRGGRGGGRNGGRGRGAG
eukprot:5906817-Amphidinium_carterae.1